MLEERYLLFPPTKTLPLCPLAPTPSHLLNSFAPELSPFSQSTGSFPLAWKHVFTCPIFKIMLSKQNKNLLQPHVPFQLLPCVSVLFLKQTSSSELSILALTLPQIQFFHKLLQSGSVLTILSRSPMTYFLPKPMFVCWIFLLASYWTSQQHVILLNTLSFLKHFLLELPGLHTGFSPPSQPALFPQDSSPS